MEEIKKVYEKLTESNKDVLNLLAKGMIIAQDENIHKENLEKKEVKQVLKVEIKINEEKQLEIGQIKATGCNCELIAHIDETTTDEEMQAFKYLKKKLNVDKGYEIANMTTKTTEKLLDEIFNNL